MGVVLCLIGYLVHLWLLLPNFRGIHSDMTTDFSLDSVKRKREGLQNLPQLKSSERRDYVECAKAPFHADAITLWQSAEWFVSDRVYKKRIFLELKVSSIG